MPAHQASLSKSTSTIIMNNLPYPEIIIDEHLTLRQVRPDEAEKLFQIIDNDREYLGKWLPFPPFTNTVQDSLNFINGTIQKRIDGSTYGFGIVLDDELIGHTSLMHVNDDQDPEIGYWIASSASGKGITTRAAQALTDFGFNELKMPKIIIKADVNNIGSNRVAEKIGYTLVRTENDNRIGLANIWELNR